MWLTGSIVATGILCLANAPAGRYTTTASTVYDTRTSLTWQRQENPSLAAWADAKSICASADIEGTGWRLPTVKELRTLIELHHSSEPYIDRSAFPDATGGDYWSSTVYAGDSGRSWGVDFSASYGVTWNYAQTSPLQVRCVR